MKAISTEYIGATSTKPSRIKVSAEGVPSKFYICDELEGTVDNIHIVAAKRFAESNDWLLKLASGGLTADSWVHCFIRESVGEKGKEVANAAKIALLSEIDATSTQQAIQIAQAATFLNIVETTPGFSWENQVTDWETICHKIAIYIPVYGVPSINNIKGFFVTNSK